MTKDERALVDEIKAEIDALARQYVLLLKTREALVKEVRQLRAENDLLKKTNGRCYWSGLLPFQWRG